VSCDSKLYLKNELGSINKEKIMNNVFCDVDLEKKITSQNLKGSIFGPA
jgi:hypothetical protein